MFSNTCYGKMKNDLALIPTERLVDRIVNSFYLICKYNTDIYEMI